MIRFIVLIIALASCVFLHSNTLHAQKAVLLGCLKSFGKINRHVRIGFGATLSEAKRDAESKLSQADPSCKFLLECEKPGWLALCRSPRSMRSEQTPSYSHGFACEWPSRKEAVREAYRACQRKAAARGTRCHFCSSYHSKNPASTAKSSRR